jgi:hypothetical protein
MSGQTRPEAPLTPAPDGRAKEAGQAPAAPPRRPSEVEEIGGPPGPEPTRYGDWEKGGRCSDF